MDHVEKKQYKIMQTTFQIFQFKCMVMVFVFIAQDAFKRIPCHLFIYM